MPQLYTNETLPGVLQVVWSSDAGEDSVGERLHKVFPYTLFLGRQSVTRIGAELVRLNLADNEEACKVWTPFSSEWGIHTSFDKIPFSHDLAEKYNGKIVLFDKFTSPCGDFKREYLCKQFSNSTVIWSQPLQYFGSHDGKYNQEFQDCEILNHDNPAQFTNLLEHVKSNVTLRANLQTAPHPWIEVLDSTWISILFSWIPGLLCLIFAQFAIRSLVIRWRHDWRTGDKWHVLFSLMINSITLSVLSVFFFLDGYGTSLKTPLNYLEQGFFSQGFSLSRIGVNLAISICWFDLSIAFTAKPTSRMKRRLLEFGVLLFCFAEIPVSFLLLNVSTANEMMMMTPAILVVAESLVSTFFIYSGLTMLKTLNQMKVISSTSLTNALAIKRLSTLIVLSGINSVLNICFFILLTIFLDSVMNSSDLFLGMMGPLIYFRLVDAFIQLLVLKPNRVDVVPQVVSHLARVTMKISMSTSKYKVGPSLTSREQPPKRTEVDDAKPNALSETALDSRWQTAVTDY